jgi:hypothetical protein
MKSFYLLIAFILSSTLSFSQGLKLNELMSSNASSIQDYNGKHEDWIEIYNGSTSAIDLVGYYLSDDSIHPYKWKFPSKIINAGQFLVIFASGNDRVYPNSEIHTNFSISEAGEMVSLTTPWNTLADTITSVKLSFDISYGRTIDGTGPWAYFSLPTPAISNSGSISYAGILSDPSFSSPGGFYTSAFYLSITQSDLSASIYYTTDGSVPTTSSKLYTSHILIKSRIGNPNKLSLIRTAFDPNWDTPSGEIEKATIVRAKIFKAGYIPGKTISHTYFVDSKIKSRYAVPVFSILTDTSNLFNYDSGIYVPGKIFDDYAAAHPTANYDGGTPANYNQPGKAWEKPAHIEYFDKSGSRLFSQNIGIGIHGNYTRANRQKALNLDAGKKYDDKSDLDFEFFPGLKAQNNKSRPLIKFKNLMLRNSDFGASLLRDGFMQSLISHTNIDIQEYKPCVVFIDGEYWGLQDLREKFNLDYLENNYGISQDSVAILYEQWLYEGVAGGDLSFQDLMSYVSFNDMSLQSSIDYVKTKMDISNYANYNAFEIYINNGDWPGNNTKIWRKLVNYTPNAPMGHDGRWRWAVYDTDFGFNIWGGISINLWNSSFKYNTLKFATFTGGPVWPNPPWSTLLLRNLLRNSEFKNLFINSCADHLNTSFKEERVSNQLSTMSAAIASELPPHINRWKAPWSIYGWYWDITNMDSFALFRPTYLRQHIISYFNLTGKYTVTLDVSDTLHGQIIINDLLIDKNTIGITGPSYPWQGIYFNNIPITLKAIPAKGYQFVKWKETGSVNDSIKVSNNADEIYTAEFELKKPIIPSKPFIPSAKNIRIYPNPAMGSFKIFSNDVNEGQVNVKLIDMLGKEFYSGSFNKNSANFEAEVDVSRIPAGMYVIKLEAEQNIYYSKIVLEK